MAKPLRPLTAEQIARARVLRDQRMSWEDISKDSGVRGNKVRVRNALVAEGYPSALGPVPIAAAAMQEMHDAYMTEDLDARQSLGDLEKRYGVDRRRVGECVIAMGGTIRKGNTKPDAKKTHAYTRWGADVKCAIGAVMEEGRPKKPVGSYYCSEYCAWTDCQKQKPCGLLDESTHRCGKKQDAACEYCRDMCDVEVTDDNRLGFASFLAHRADDARKIAGDRKYRPSHKGKAEDQALLAREMRGERDE